MLGIGLPFAAGAICHWKVNDEWEYEDKPADEDEQNRFDGVSDRFQVVFDYALVVARARRLPAIIRRAFAIPNVTVIKSVRKTDIPPTQSGGITWSTGG